MARKKKQYEDNRVMMKIDRYKVGEVSAKEALTYNLQMLNNQMQYMSVDNIKKWLTDAIDQVIEVFDEDINFQTKKRFNNVLEFMDKITTHEKMMMYIVDIILSMEGLGNLNNFHIGKFNVNAEKISLTEMRI